jgi:hypothetical protein
VETGLAEPEPEPEQGRDVDREEHVAEERVADAHVRRDRAAEVAGPEDDPEDGGPRVEVEGGAGELDG